MAGSRIPLPGDESPAPSRWGGPPPPRASVVGRRSMVASAHSLASATGHAVLASGGTAVDAALAMAAMTAVVLPAQCGVGGDAFAVVRDPTGAVRAVQGSGYGPDGADLAFFTARDLSAVPQRGPLSIAVPGWVSAIAALHELGATRPLAELFAPAIALARSGIAVGARLAAELSAADASLTTDLGSAGVFAPRGTMLGVGDLLVQRDLADTLTLVAADPSAFYRGKLGEQMVSALQAQGAPFSGEEWEMQRASVTSAPEIAYAGHRVFTTAPPSPGYMILQQLGLCADALAGAELLSPNAVATMARAAMHAFADRFAAVSSDTDTWRSLLAPAALAAGRARLAGALPRAPGLVGGDTTSLVAVDGDGGAVSWIHSIAFSFGSGITIPGTGVLLNDRLGRGAYLLAGHPNAVSPRRRPMHTLCAWIATSPDGELRAVGGTPGGDGQVQWNVQLLSHLLDHALDPQDAVDAPRFTVSPGSDADALGQPWLVTCESRLDPAVRAALARDDLALRTIGPWAGGGAAQIVAVRDGALFGGSDPRADGCALGA